MNTFRLSTEADYHRALFIRRSVFILEQGVPEEIEIDEYESSSIHFLTVDSNGSAIATGRLRTKDSFIKFERIATLKEFRGMGVGQNLMGEMIRYARENYAGLTPFMHSQSSAVSFYEKLGWVTQGPIFFEAGISHQAMILPLPK